MGLPMMLYRLQIDKSTSASLGLITFVTGSRSVVTFYITVGCAVYPVIIFPKWPIMCVVWDVNPPILTHASIDHRVDVQLIGCCIGSTRSSRSTWHRQHVSLRVWRERARWRRQNNRWSTGYSRSGGYLQSSLWPHCASYDHVIFTSKLLAYCFLELCLICFNVTIIRISLRSLK